MHSKQNLIEIAAPDRGVMRRSCRRNPESKIAVAPMGCKARWVRIPILMLVVGGGILAAAPPSYSRDLTIVMWGGAMQDALREAYITPFSQQTGTPVVEDADPTMAKVKGMVETNNVVWDLMDWEGPDVAVGCEQGILEEIDYSRLDTSDLLENKTVPCGVPIYTAGNVLVYDASRLKDPPKSWVDFWNVDKWPGKRGFWFTPKSTLEAALLADGVAPQDIYKVLGTPAGVDRAFAKLDQLKPNILWWESGAESMNRLASGEYAMTLAWTGRVDVANRQDQRNFKVAWEAGFTYIDDLWVIPKGSPNLDQAYEFLKFYLNGDRQAKFMELIAASAPSKSAYTKLGEDRLEALPLAAEHQQYGFVMDNEFWLKNYESLTERFQAWAAQ